MRIHPYIAVLLFCSITCCEHIDSVKEAPIDDISITNSNEAKTPNMWLHQNILHITWTEDIADTTYLYYSSFSDGQRNAKNLVAKGTDWFVNWADFSSIIIDPNQPNRMMTHWLEKSNEGTYDYDIMIATSTDGGATWSQGRPLHNDGISAEHGFVSVENYDSDHFFASWLDGRNTKTPDIDHDGKMLPMSLRAGLINKTDRTISEFAIDQKVCDCCQTSSTPGSRGMLVAYRDRSDKEIRDIVIQTFDKSGSKVVFESEDHWKINGCPVNGPALASNVNWEAMVWYTAADSAAVYLVYGKNTAFDHKIKIDNGNPLGRVDVEIVGNKAYVTWLEMKDQRTEIRLKTINLNSQVVLNDQMIVHTSPERRSGFPILKVSSTHIYIAHTEVLSADHTTVRLKQIKL